MPCYTCINDQEFATQGLAVVFEDADASRLPATHTTRIRNILTRLEFAKSLDDIGMPGLRLHPLSGRLKGYYAVNVSGNWRIICRFEGRDVFDVD